MVQSYRNDLKLDADLFNQQMKLINDFFAELLNRENLGGTHPLRADKEATEELLYGVEKSKIKGLGDKKEASISKNGLYGITGHYDKSLSFSLYMRFAFLNEFLYFSSTTLSDLKTFNNFKDATKDSTNEEALIYNFLMMEPVRNKVKEIYDSIPSQSKNTKNAEFIRQLMNF